MDLRVVRVQCFTNQTPFLNMSCFVLEIEFSLCTCMNKLCYIMCN